MREETGKRAEKQRIKDHPLGARAFGPTAFRFSLWDMGLRNGFVYTQIAGDKDASRRSDLTISGGALTR